MGVQQYCLRVVYMFINLEGIFTKMVKMTKQYWGNVASIFNFIWVEKVTADERRGLSSNWLHLWWRLASRRRWAVWGSTLRTRPRAYVLSSSSSCFLLLAGHSTAQALKSPAITTGFRFLKSSTIRSSTLSKSSSMRHAWWHVAALKKYAKSVGSAPTIVAFTQSELVAGFSSLWRKPGWGTRFLGDIFHSWFFIRGALP